MVQVRDITKAEMWQLYKENMLDKITNLGDRIVAHNMKGMSNSEDGYEIVRCPYP